MATKNLTFFQVTTAFSESYGQVASRGPDHLQKVPIGDLRKQAARFGVIERLDRLSGRAAFGKTPKAGSL